MEKKANLVQRYLEEGLVALLPGPGGREGGTLVLTLKGSYGDKRSLPWLVELLARFYRLDVAAVRRHSGRLLGLRHHIPLPLTEGVVLLPLKVAHSAPPLPGEGTTGYVNLLQIEEVIPLNPGDSAPPSASSRHGDPAAGRSLLNCGGGQVICCGNTAATVREKIRQGEAVHRELLQRHKLAAAPAAPPFHGLDGTALRQMLPSCSCLLRSFFLWLLDSAMLQQREQ